MLTRRLLDNDLPWLEYIFQRNFESVLNRSQFILEWNFVSTRVHLERIWFMLNSNFAVINFQNLLLEKPWHREDSMFFWNKINLLNLKMKCSLRVTQFNVEIAEFKDFLSTTLNNQIRTRDQKWGSVYCPHFDWEFEILTHKKFRI